MESALTHSQILAIAQKALIETFDSFHSKGLLSMYLWGSVTRDDFDPGVSDVDSLAIVDDRADTSIQDDIKSFLKQAAPLISDFGVAVLYLSELNGSAPRSFLATVMPKGVNHMLLMFPDWQFVVGQKFNRSDFSEPDMTLDEEIQSHLSSALDKINNLDNPKRNIRKDLVKTCLKLAYFRAWKANGKFELNYDNLESHALQQDKPLIQQICLVRKLKRYEPEIFDKTSLTPIIDWLDLVQSEVK